VRTALKALFAVTVFALIIAPPFLLGTKVYPVAVVQGNSMFPVLQNGELVIFRGINTENIPNGTIIVAVEGGAPANFLNYLVRPVIIHEVFSRIVNQYGRVYYQTKGVNNPYPDPFLIPASNVLGTPVFAVPYLGFLFLFVSSSPEGLVFLIGVLTVYYIESYERAKNKEKAARLRFLIPFVFLNFEKKLSNEALLRITQLAEHCEELASFGDPTALWLYSNLRKKEYRIVKCEKHGDDAAEFFGKDVLTLRICVKEAEEVLKQVFEIKTSELPR